MDTKKYIVPIFTLKTGEVMEAGKISLDESSPVEAARKLREFLNEVDGWISIEECLDGGPAVLHKDNIAFISFPLLDFYEDPETEATP